MRSEIDVPRLIAVVTVLLALFAGTLVVLQAEPALGAAEARLTEDRDALTSDEVAFASLPAIERRRHVLAERFAPQSGNGGARFLRALSGIARRHGVRVVLTSFERDVAPAPAPAPDADARFFRSEKCAVTLRGPYAGVLRAIADVSAGPQIVRVDPPNLTRAGDGDDVTATIPVSILEPVEAAP